MVSCCTTTFSKANRTIVAYASLAPGGGRSHEIVAIYHGPNLISWRSGSKASHHYRHVKQN
eukprot:8082280-Prorocentrum_lima.AAC.1